MRRQFFDLRPGQTLTIGGSRITLEAKTGQRARLRVESDAPTALDRQPDTHVSRPEAAQDAAPPTLLQRPRLAG